MTSQVRVRCLLGHPPKLTIIEIVVSGRKPNLRKHATGLRDGPIDDHGRLVGHLATGLVPGWDR